MHRYINSVIIKKLKYTTSSYKNVYNIFQWIFNFFFGSCNHSKTKKNLVFFHIKTTVIILLSTIILLNKIITIIYINTIEIK